MRLERWLNAIAVVIGFVSVLGLAHPPPAVRSAHQWSNGRVEDFQSWVRF